MINIYNIGVNIHPRVFLYRILSFYYFFNITNCTCAVDGNGAVLLIFIKRKLQKPCKSRKEIIKNLKTDREARFRVKKKTPSDAAWPSEPTVPHCFSLTTLALFSYFGKPTVPFKNKGSNCKNTNKKYEPVLQLFMLFLSSAKTSMLSISLSLWVTLR
jgi:hypothetical protein